MALTREQVLEILYPRPNSIRGQRFTQDTPILLDVWVAFAESADANPRVLLTPNSNSTLEELVKRLRIRLAIERGEPDPRKIRLAYNETHVMTWLTFRELIRSVLPLSAWWRKYIVKAGILNPDFLGGLKQDPRMVDLLLEPACQDENGIYSEDLLNLLRVVGCILLDKPLPSRNPRKHLERALDAVAGLMADFPLAGIPPQTETPPLWNVFLNRPAINSISRSRQAIKADAACLLFGISCKELRWAVIDSGVDAQHPAFAKDSKKAPPGAQPISPKETRIVETYDFTRLEKLMNEGFDVSGENAPEEFAALSAEQRTEIQEDMEKRLLNGRPVDWSLLGPFLRISHDPAKYKPPVHEHGTHVAGIIAANWPKETSGLKSDFIGVSPDIELYDMRVFDDTGNGDEFTILAAMQFIRWLNQSRDRLVLHGANLSLSVRHEVDSFACGATPICEEANRVVASGVVVVTAAGNLGYERTRGYQDISITDPGNADDVLTVGATHRYMPHKYGVSFFSSRGPTGDGRLKPDLVAPGEKIESTIPGGKTVALDGTSMAAPHVSGAAALLMARHRELIGQPLKIKAILCKTATDLGRERYFQGAGMLDVLRALQSV